MPRDILALPAAGQHKKANKARGCDMPIFELTPNNADLPDWEASTYRGPCRVGAPDSFAARRYAHAQFIDNAVEGQYRGQRKIFCPWTDQSLVRCRQVAEDGAIDLPAGSVMVAGKQGWEAVAPVTAQTEADGPAALKADEKSTIQPPDDTERVARVVENKDLLARQARDLLAVLDDLAASISTAEAKGSSPQKRRSNDLADDELHGLLRATRDELRQLNSLLQTAQTQDRKLPRALSEVRTSVAALSNAARGRFRN